MKSIDCYKDALPIARTIGDFRMEIDIRTGLAHLYVHQGSWTEALAQVEEVLGLDPSLGGSLWSYLNCYQILQLYTQTILKSAYNLLTEQADKINDEELRDSFLNNVAVHKEIREEFGKNRHPPRQRSSHRRGGRSRR